MSAEPVVTDAMAFAFHAALFDSPIGESEIAAIKRGLLAALRALPQPDPVAEQDKELTRAKRTLALAGYTDAGGELWKPPIGPSASPLLTRIDELTADRQDCYAEDITAEANAAFDEGRADAFGDIARAAAKRGLTHKTVAPEKACDLIAFAVAVLRFSGVRQAGYHQEQKKVIDDLRCKCGKFEAEAAQLRTELRRLQASLAGKEAKS